MTRFRILAVVACLATGGLMAAAAAQLSVLSDDLGAGVDLVSSCDEDGVDVAFTEVTYDPLVPGGPGFAVMKITVSDIALECNGQYISAGLIDENGVQIGSAIPEGLLNGPPPPIEITGTSKELIVLQEPPLGFGVSAEAVEKIGVVITASNFFGA